LTKSDKAVTKQFVGQVIEDLQAVLRRSVGAVLARRKVPMAVTFDSSPYRSYLLRVFGKLPLGNMWVLLDLARTSLTSSPLRSIRRVQKSGKCQSTTVEADVAFVLRVFADLVYPISKGSISTWTAQDLVDVVNWLHDHPRGPLGLGEGGPYDDIDDIDERRSKDVQASMEVEFDMRNGCKTMIPVFMEFMSEPIARTTVGLKRKILSKEAMLRKFISTASSSDEESDA
jgi:hypothetical protein